MSEQIEGRTEIARVLYGAARILEPEGAWCQGWYAKDANGMDVRAMEDDCDALSPRACQFCAVGAIRRAAGDAEEAVDPAVDVLVRVVKDDMNASVTLWNDAPERTQAEVVAKLREAAALADTEAVTHE